MGGASPRTIGKTISRAAISEVNCQYCEPQAVSILTIHRRRSSPVHLVSRTAARLHFQADQPWTRVGLDSPVVGEPRAFRVDLHETVGSPRRRSGSAVRCAPCAYSARRCLRRRDSPSAPAPSSPIPATAVVPSTAPERGGYEMDSVDPVYSEGAFSGNRTARQLPFLLSSSTFPPRDTQSLLSHVGPAQPSTTNGSSAIAHCSTFNSAWFRLLNVCWQSLWSAYPAVSVSAAIRNSGVIRFCVLVMYLTCCYRLGALLSVGLQTASDGGDNRQRGPDPHPYFYY